MSVYTNEKKDSQVGCTMAVYKLVYDLHNKTYLNLK